MSFNGRRGSSSVHPLQGDEMRALRRLQRAQEASSHVFSSERGGPMTPKSFHTLYARIGLRANMPFPTHPHCCAMPAAMLWPMRITTPVRCKPT
jgi:hypothetical protein